MISTKPSALLLGLLFYATSLDAQLPFALEVEGRAGYAFPVGDFGSGVESVGVDGGPAFAFGVLIHPLNLFGVYVGYQQLRFGCTRCELFDLDSSVVGRGVEAGVHFVAPQGRLPVTPWGRAGLVRQTLAFSAEEGQMISSAGIGFSGGAGVGFEITRRLAIQGGLRYLSAPADFRFTIVPDQSLNVTAFTADLGATFRF